ncbi:MAG TPA: N-acetylmuramic acid 6-phosphate etherase [Terriglobales bacterium]
MKGGGKRSKERLERLTTEKANPASRELDRMAALEIVRLINQEDAKVAGAVAPALPQIAKAIDWIVSGLNRGGRLIYVGTGTSGRIAALDAVECPPTFNTDPRTVQFVMAGGLKALVAATEASEDSRSLGEREIAKRKPGKNDVVVGVAASGRTPFTVAAVAYARRRGAKTVAVTCNRNSPLEKASHLAIVTQVGPEVLAGSSRMKAGTAQKMVLNMLSTGAMIRAGRVYGNLMVDLHLKNKKLRERGIRNVARITGRPRRTATRALLTAGSVPVAIVMMQADVSKKAAERALQATGRNVRLAVARARGERS